jgi:hypothetical protein
VHVRLPPSSESAHAARLAVADFLRRLDRADLVDDVSLMVTELVANGVMHARTEMSVAVEPAGAGVRVSVTDSSDILPRWTPSSPTATAGRGLRLVEQLSLRWGFEPLPGGGKRVWAEIDEPSSSGSQSSPDDLLDQWSEEAWPARAEGGTEVEAEVDVTVQIDVQAMLDSRAHTEDLVRDLQLTSLDADTDTPAETTATVVRLARRLDSANQEFHEARRQIYNQTISAGRDKRTQTTLHLRLHRSDAAPARRWLEALDEADALTAAGTLLLPPFPAELTAFRRRYIGAIVTQLDAAS